MLVESRGKAGREEQAGPHAMAIAEGAVFEDAVLAQPQTAALLQQLMEERGLKVE